MWPFCYRFTGLQQGQSQYRPEQRRGSCCYVKILYAYSSFIAPHSPLIEGADRLSFLYGTIIPSISPRIFDDFGPIGALIRRTNKLCPADITLARKWLTLVERLPLPMVTKAVTTANSGKLAIQKGGRCRCAKHPTGRSGNGICPLFELREFCL